MFFQCCGAVQCSDGARHAVMRLVGRRTDAIMGGNEDMMCSDSMQGRNSQLLCISGVHSRHNTHLRCGMQQGGTVVRCSGVKQRCDTMRSRLEAVIRLERSRWCYDSHTQLCL